jgi:6-phosphogluconolactonase/glucosamine-6-phosphate isomerase/deaminase
MTLGALLRSDEIILLFFGTEKFDIYEQAKSAISGLPVAHLLAQKRTPVQVYWAP